MEKDLLRLVGAGMATLAIEYTTPPVGAIEDGEAFVEALLAFGGRTISDATIEATRTLWRDCCKAGLAQAMTQAHIAALPAILDRHRPTGLALVEALGAFDSLAGARKMPATATVGLAAMVIVTAETKGALSKAGLSQPIAFFLTERLLASVVQHRALLGGLRHEIARHFKPQARITAAASRAAASTGVPIWPRRFQTNAAGA